MVGTEQSWKRVNDKLQQLVHQHQLLQKENERLKKNIGLLHEKEETHLKKIEALELKVAALKAATGRLDEAEKKELDKRLGLYIREIDRCIAMLSE